jgi:type IV pilus assembly protein PilA
MIALPHLTVRWGTILMGAVLLLAAAIAVGFAFPSSFLEIPMPGSTKADHESAALRSMRAIQRAEMAYESTYPANGFACTLDELGGDPSAGAASPASGQLIQADVASGSKSGYVFSVSCNDKVTKNGTYRYNSFAVRAVPQVVGQAGTRGFCGNQFGTIQYDPAGGTNCTQPIE